MDVYVFIVRYLPFFLFSQLALIIILTIYCFKSIRKEFGKIDRKVWFFLLLILIFGFYLRNNVYSHHHYEDGWEYHEIAKYMATQFKFQGCYIGNLFDCKLSRVQVHPGGYSAIIAMSYWLFGIDSMHAIKISVLLSTLTILLVFLISYILFKSEDIAVLSALVFSLIPLNMKISSTSLSEPTSMFFLTLSFFLFLFSFRKKQELLILSLFAIVTSFAIQVRRENFILLPIYVLLYFILKPKIQKDKFLIPTILYFLIFAIPDFIFFIARIEGFLGQTKDPAFSIDYLIALVYPYARTFFDPSSFLPLFSLCLVLSLAFIKKREIKILVIPLLVYSLVFVSFMQNPVLVRSGKLEAYQVLFYSLQIHPFYAILAAFGAYNIIGGPRKNKVMVISAIIFMSVLMMPKENMIHPLVPKDNRLNTNTFRTIYNISANTADECYILVHYYMVVQEESSNQNVFYNVMIKAGQGQNLIRRGECVIYLEIDDWNCKNEVFGPYCQYLNDNYNLDFSYQSGGIKVYNVTSQG